MSLKWRQIFWHPHSVTSLFLSPRAQTSEQIPIYFRKIRAPVLLMVCLCTCIYWYLVRAVK